MANISFYSDAECTNELYTYSSQLLSDVFINPFAPDNFKDSTKLYVKIDDLDAVLTPHFALFVDPDSIKNISCGGEYGKSSCFRVLATDSDMQDFFIPAGDIDLKVDYFVVSSYYGNGGHRGKPAKITSIDSDGTVHLNTKIYFGDGAYLSVLAPLYAEVSGKADKDIHELTIEREISYDDTTINAGVSMDIYAFWASK